MIEEKFLQELLERVDIVDVANRHFPLKMAKLTNRAPLEPANRGLMDPLKGVDFPVSDG
jgi:hypothetical protein